MRKVIVISAVNVTSGGALTVLRECVQAVQEGHADAFDVVVVVNSNELLDIPGISTIQLSYPKKSWFLRLYAEWLEFYAISKRLDVDIWLSLHDISPRVRAKTRAVYCHNPAPFHKLTTKEAFFEPTFALFNLFYGALYRINIRSNNFVIVQQNWLKKEFIKRFGPLPMVVAYPGNQSSQQTIVTPDLRTKRVFLFPSLPRVFKNMETLCEAAKLLEARGHKSFEVRLTMDGNENRYARWLKKKYSNLTTLKFIGLQSQKQMQDQYAQASCLLFPSRLETWGLPISEAKTFNLPMLVADQKYSRETVGDYEDVSFFEANNVSQLADLMENMISDTWIPEGNRFASTDTNVIQNWRELWALLISNQQIKLESNDD